jgi:uncharacterized protein with von Willebrand factor type A (vWA) domain
MNDLSVAHLTTGVTGDQPNNRRGMAQPVLQDRKIRNLDGTDPIERQRILSISRLLKRPAT